MPRGLDCCHALQRPRRLTPAPWDFNIGKWNLTDAEALALKFPLSEAQEIIALESGYENWAALKGGLPAVPKQARPLPEGPMLKAALPVAFVSNVMTGSWTKQV